jgi:hypothetical protein
MIGVSSGVENVSSVRIVHLRNSLYTWRGMPEMLHAFEGIDGCQNNYGIEYVVVAPEGRVC